MSPWRSLLRMQLVGWPQVYGWYVGILGLTLLINVLIWMAMSAEERGTAQTFGLVAIYVVSLVGFSKSLTQMFPFALGLGATRREFFGAVTVVAALGIFWGSVVRRWGTHGVLALYAGASLVVGLATLWITWQDLWSTIADGVADWSVVETWSVWPLVPVVAMLGAAFAIVRRTTA